MLRKTSPRAFVAFSALSLASCATGPSFVAQDEPWRKDTEIACLNSGAVQASAFVAPRESITGGDGYCGAVHPFEVAAIDNGQVSLKPAALVQCAMIPALDEWASQVVERAARSVYGVGVAQLRVLASYSCRPMNNEWGAKLSEHGHANAVDIGSFTLANGVTVSVLNGWNGSAADRRFLRLVHDGACGFFTTVLGPDANSYHRDHFHLDLMPRHIGRGVCE